MKMFHNHRCFVYHTQEPLLRQALCGKLCKVGPYTPNLLSVIDKVGV